MNQSIYQIYQLAPPPPPLELPLLHDIINSISLKIRPRPDWKNSKNTWAKDVRYRQAKSFKLKIYENTIKNSQSSVQRYKNDNE